MFTPEMSYYGKDIAALGMALQTVLIISMPEPQNPVLWVHCPMAGQSAKAVLHRYVYNRFPATHRKRMRGGGRTRYYLSNAASDLLAQMCMRQSKLGTQVSRNLARDYQAALTEAIKHFLSAELARPKIQTII